MEILLIGAGGIGSLIGLGLVKKGAGGVRFCDHDIVGPENLNRQFFDRRNLFKNKAVECCRKLSGEGFLGTGLHAHPCSFQELDLDSLRPDVVVCGVDDQMRDTRVRVCRWAHARGIPAVFVAVTPDADAGYVLIQKPGEACWECVQKSAMERRETPNQRPTRCPGTPASIDILLPVVGYALYAIDTLVMARPRNWNFVYLSLSRPGSILTANAPRRENCAVCGSAGCSG